VLRLQADHASWTTSLNLGRLDEALRHAEAGLAVYDSGRHAPLSAIYGNHDAGVCARCFQAWVFGLKCDDRAAIRAIDDAAALGRSLNHPFSLAMAFFNAAAVHQLQRDVAAAGVAAREAGRIATDQGFPLLGAWAATVDGWTLVESGSCAEGL